MVAHKPLFATLSISLLLIIGLGGIYGGYSLVSDPTGGSLGLPATLYEEIPLFSNLFIPGLLLLFTLGLLPLVAAVGMIRFRPGKPEKMGKMHWSWKAALFSGILLILWIAIQILMIGFQTFLQPLFGVVGIVLNWLLTTAPVRMFYQDPQKA